MVYFDSYNWNTIKNAIKTIKEKEGLHAGTTQKGELMTMSLGGKNTLVTNTYEHNGWVRINTYNCDDYTTTETYVK